MSTLSVNDIYQFGDQFELKTHLRNNNENMHDIIEDLKSFNNKWSQYNPRKEINRQGLCVLNDTGVVGPGPALDSLYEYNKEHYTNITETDCNKPTELFYKSKFLQACLSDMLPWICRTHFLRLGSGGFFPTHRDHKFGVQNCFRIIAPILNCKYPSFFFLLENKLLDWNYGSFYVINTTKAHTLFNASMDDSIWLIINAIVCKESIDFICNNLMIT